MALITLKMPKWEKLPTPRGAAPTLAGWAAPAPSAPADTGVWMRFYLPLQGFLLPSCDCLVSLKQKASPCRKALG